MRFPVLRTGGFTAPVYPSNDSNWDSGWNTSGSGNPWDFEPKDPLGGWESGSSGSGPSRETEERHAFGDSDTPPWPSRNYDGSPEREGGCLGALVGLLALPVASIVGALVAVMN